jgi:hypothetical protein
LIQPNGKRVWTGDFDFDGAKHKATGESMV